jgi:hypothetical protein
MISSTFFTLFGSRQSISSLYIRRPVNSQQTYTPISQQQHLSGDVFFSAEKQPPKKYPSDERTDARRAVENRAEHKRIDRRLMLENACKNATPPINLKMLWPPQIELPPLKRPLAEMTEDEKKDRHNLSEIV